MKRNKAEALRNALRTREKLMQQRAEVEQARRLQPGLAGFLCTLRPGLEPGSGGAGASGRKLGAPQGDLDGGESGRVGGAFARLLACGLELGEGSPEVTEFAFRLGDRDTGVGFQIGVAEPRSR